ncbi:MAG TPA: GNAT family N-acetyltransferase [Pyrinomonadaceae bacterium]|jgi:hypothetical protein
MIRVVQYTAEHKRRWDEFVAQAKNGVFLFRRDYMDYHADRFQDHSLLFFADEKLVGLLPANLAGDALVSHGGLTFGGIVCDARMRSATMLDLFAALSEHARAVGAPRIIYKPVPHIYHGAPAEEDLYALFRHEARLVRRDLSDTIAPHARLPLTKGRKWSLKQSQAHPLDVRRSDDFATFIAIETEVLQTKYGIRPVHTAAELALLAARFPDNIKLFAAYRGAAMLAGVVIYESAQVAHAQYIAANEEGRQCGATDRILDLLINEHYAAKPYFDFGISTEQGGRHLNVGLAEYKESFGARAVVYDFYELTV